MKTKLPDLTKLVELDVFDLIKLYAVKIVSTALFLVFIYVIARYEIIHLLAR